MKRYRILILFLLLMPVSYAFGQTGPDDKDKNSKASAKKGDPPPGGAIRLSSGIARIIVRGQLQKRHLTSTKAILLTPAYSLLESKNIRVTRENLSFDYDLTSGTKQTTQHETLEFKKLDYVHVVGANSAGTLYTVFRGPFGQGINYSVYSWNEKSDAQQFADAINRLIYEVRVVITPKDDLTPFAADVQAWRDKPESRPVAPDGWDRHRILAEQGIKEKNFAAALINYEAGVAAYPLWSQGWFNAALLYAEFQEYGSAANRMKHYLLLVPDAPDAKAAREKTIIWEDKAKQ